MVLIKYAALLKTFVGFGEGETEDLDKITKPKPECEGGCTLLLAKRKQDLTIARGDI